MSRWLKRGLDQNQVKIADIKVREVVENIITQIENRGDAAVREFSKQFDDWEPQHFRLSESDIQKAISQVHARDL